MRKILIIGAGPAGIFTALELLKQGSKDEITIIEQGRLIENRVCPKAKTKDCIKCKPHCNITSGFSGAGAFSDGKYNITIYNKDGQFITNYTVNKVAPLNASARFIIIIVSVVVIALVVAFIILRRHTKFR